MIPTAFPTKEPFTLASGAQSPTYIDCRKLISHPRIRATLMDFLTCTVMREAGFEAFDNIAGGETAGIPFAALVAERMALPMTYVRKKPKGYGKNARTSPPTADRRSDSLMRFAKPAPHAATRR
jgi:orotate phosphoribosyltransferase